MKTKHIVTWIAITLLAAGTALAQGGPGRGGYGAPPKTEEERVARQAERQQVNTGKQANRGNRANQGQNRGRGNGSRDGSGPRGGTANCPAGT